MKKRFLLFLIVSFVISVGCKKDSRISVIEAFQKWERKAEVEILSYKTTAAESITISRTRLKDLGNGSVMKMGESRGSYGFWLYPGDLYFDDRQKLIDYLREPPKTH